MPRQTVAAIDRAVDVLALFSDIDQPTLGVTEISQRLGLSKAVVHRVLASFRAKGFIELDEASHRYSLGPGVLRLGQSYLDRADVRSVARPVLEELSAETGETVALWVRNASQVVCIDHAASTQAVRWVVRIGQGAALHESTASKVILASLTAEDRDQHLERLGEDADLKALRRELDEIRDRGHAVSRDDLGTASVAAPVQGRSGSTAAVISVAGPIERFGVTLEAATRTLLGATSRLSRRLGGRTR